MNAVYKVDGIFISTKRLILRPFKENDLNDFYEYAKVDGVGERAGWKHHESLKESKEILDLFIKNKIDLAIIDKNNNKVIGSLGAKELIHPKAISTNLKGREIGYVLAKPYWGRGLMNEAVMAFLDYIFKHFDIDFMTVSHFEFNNQSKRVIEKSGFTLFDKNQMEEKYSKKIMNCYHYIIFKDKNNKLD